MVSLRLAGAVVSVGLADSLNPSTIGPALFLATGARRVARVLQFTAGVLIVNLVAGAIVLFGPGRLLLGLVPHPQRAARHVIEVVAGAVLLAAGLAVWFGRRALARRELPMQEGGGRSAFLLGASIAAVELPTAVAYFAIIAAIVASSANLVGEAVLLVIYNLAFVLPMIAIAIVLVVAGERADDLLTKAGAWVQRKWPVVLAGLLLLIGGGLIIVGGIGLVRG